MPVPEGGENLACPGVVAPSVPLVELNTEGGPGPRATGLEGSAMDTPLPAPAPPGRTGSVLLPEEDNKRVSGGGAGGGEDAGGGGKTLPSRPSGGTGGGAGSTSIGIDAGGGGEEGGTFDEDESMGGAAEAVSMSTSTSILGVGS